MAMSPPIGGRASEESWFTALTIWLSSEVMTGPPDVRLGRNRRHIDLDVVAGGEPGRGRIEPTIVTPRSVDELAGDDPIARHRQRLAGPELAGVGRQVRRIGRQGTDEGGDGRRRHVDGRGRPVGDQVVGEAGQRPDPGRPTGNDQAPTARDPAAEGRQLGVVEAIAVDVLPDQAVERRPALDALGQVGHDE
jgi:hypothetical protein